MQPETAFVAEFVGTSNVIRGPSAETLLGQSGIFSIRPEHIRFAREAAKPEEIHVQGILRDVHYQGAATRYEVMIDNGVRLFVSQGNTQEQLYSRYGIPVNLFACAGKGMRWWRWREIAEMEMGMDYSEVRNRPARRFSTFISSPDALFAAATHAAVVMVWCYLSWVFVYLALAGRIYL